MGPYLFYCLFFCPLLMVWMFEIAGQGLERQIVYITIQKNQLPVYLCVRDNRARILYLQLIEMTQIINRLASSLV
jgi:hypothetical protein